MSHILSIAICITLIAGCKKDTKKGLITFYQTKYKDCELIVDGENKGHLYKSLQMPVCGDNVTNRVQSVELSYGEHRYWLEEFGAKISPSYNLNVQKTCNQQEVK
jgi:hypothetical protein